MEERCKKVYLVQISDISNQQFSHFFSVEDYYVIVHRITTMKNSKLTDEALKELENEITKKLISKLEVLVEEKCEAFFVKHHIPNIEEPRITEEILMVKNSLTAIESDMKLLQI